MHFEMKRDEYPCRCLESTLIACDVQVFLLGDVTKAYRVAPSEFKGKVDRWVFVWYHGMLPICLYAITGFAAVLHIYVDYLPYVYRDIRSTRREAAEV